MKYIALKPIQLPPGTLVGLERDQVVRRAHLLEKQKGGRHVCLDRVWIKLGETVELYDEPPKYLRDSLAPVDDGEPAGGDGVTGD